MTARSLILPAARQAAPAYAALALAAAALAGPVAPAFAQASPPEPQ